MSISSEHNLERIIDRLDDKIMHLSNECDRLREVLLFARAQVSHNAHGKTATLNKIDTALAGHLK